MYDWTGKSLEASVVFAHSIIYLKKWIYKEIEKAIFDIENKDIEYVFTVPETKGDRATLLIREAAIKVRFVTICKKNTARLYFLLLFNYSTVILKHKKIFKNNFNDTIANSSDIYSKL